MLTVDIGQKVPQVQDSYLNANSLDSVKAMGRAKDPQALKEISQKFEAMFVQQMLKSMREANEVFSEGNYFDSSTTRFHRDMLDQQMVLNLTSGRGIGLADHFYKQMMQAYGDRMKGDADSTTKSNSGELPMAVVNSHSVQAGAEENSKVFANNLDNLNAWVVEFMRMSDNTNAQFTNHQPMQAESQTDNQVMSGYVPELLSKPQAMNSRLGHKSGVSESQEHFVAMIKPHAEKAAAELQINPDVLIAQVALETGWGKHVIHDRKGNNSFNLFNIKASANWGGDKVNIATLEFRDGIAASEKADFRKYNDYAESFSDYVKLMKHNPRYQEVLSAGKNSSAYAEALQSAGYATDPQYAKKIKSLLNSNAIRSIGEIAQTAKSFIINAANAGRKLVE